MEKAEFQMKWPEGATPAIVLSQMLQETAIESYMAEIPRTKCETYKVTIMVEKL